jgi:hypothetical protein
MGFSSANTPVPPSTRGCSTTPDTVELVGSRSCHVSVPATPISSAHADLAGWWPQLLFWTSLPSGVVRGAELAPARCAAVAAGLPPAQLTTASALRAAQPNTRACLITHTWTRHAGDSFHPRTRTRRPQTTCSKGDLNPHTREISPVWGNFHESSITAGTRGRQSFRVRAAWRPAGEAGVPGPWRPGFPGLTAGRFVLGGPVTSRHRLRHAGARMGRPGGHALHCPQSPGRRNIRRSECQQDRQHTQIRRTDLVGLCSPRRRNRLHH